MHYKNKVLIILFIFQIISIKPIISQNPDLEKKGKLKKGNGECPPSSNVKRIKFTILRDKNVKNEDHHLKNINLGFSLGPNLSYSSISKNEVKIKDLGVKYLDTKFGVGANFSFIFGIRLSKIFEVKTFIEFILSSKTINYSLDLMNANQSEYRTLNLNKPTEYPNPFDYYFSTIALEFPIFLKINALRINNYRIFLLTGMRYSRDLANLNPSQQFNFRLKEDDISVDLGFGNEFYFDFFKLGIQVTFNNGLLNINGSDGTFRSESILEMFSRRINIQFNFE